MEQFEIFEAEKNDIINKLNKLQQIIERLEGGNLSADITKIKNTIKSIEEETLKISLIGAFSDGKTSVVAGWLGKLMDNMKIDTNESSDELTVYKTDDLLEKCEIVDTPGLFGSKETIDVEGNPALLGDVTKQFISEANMIFYVVDAVNPLKDSHKDIVKWVLRELNKLCSTIFIINKMDGVASLKDDIDFKEKAAIKKKNLVEKIERFANLTPDELKQLNVVCMSSDPNARGLDYWFDNKDIYQERSRINDLKDITSHILDNNTKRELIKKAGADVCKDIVARKIDDTEKQLSAVSVHIASLRSSIQKSERELESSRAEVISVKNDLFEELSNMEKRLLSRVRSLSMEEVKPFLEDEIGLIGSEDSFDVGYKLRIAIQNKVENSFNKTSQIMGTLAVSIERNIEAYEQFSDSVTSSLLQTSSTALTALSKVPVNQIRDGVLMARNAIAKLTGMVFKFKPWGAIKLSQTLSKCAGAIAVFIPIAIDIYDKIQQQKAEEALKEIKNDISELIKAHFKLVYDILGDNDIALETFAPQLKIYQNLIDSQNLILKDFDNKSKVLIEVKNDFSELQY